ncbi:hypothetical protein GGR53DRAFT_21867 [Hypoxylon sp. FL1150]|nr:hypothetical protein GGR53DRAFT_21867 [Hypoxylon sp. FL1150]
MLPPIDEAVLQTNPDFERLYKTVTSSLLNADGSTKSHDPVAKKREAVRDELKSYRLKAAKQNLIRGAIASAASSDPDPDPNHVATRQTEQHQHQPQSQAQAHRRTRSQPQIRIQRQRLSTSAPPPEIIDLLLLLPPFLSNAATMPPASLALLLSRPPFSDLQSLFPTLTTALSTTLSHQANALARVLNPNTNPSYIHRSIPLLPGTTHSLQTSITNSTALLSRSRQLAAHALLTHLTDHTQALVQLLRVLESKHGPAARSAALRAEEAGLEAQTWGVAAEALLWDARRTVYPAEARRALGNYKRHLGDARMRVADAVRVREAELGDYGVGVGVGETGGAEEASKERTMREMARVWREMEERLEEVRADLDRLG